MRTVQGDIDDGLSRLFSKPVSTVGAGRTDAGVHALAQVMSTQDAPDDCEPPKVLASLNKMCGPAIAVHDCRVVPQDFHARFSARSRTYVYAIFTGAVHDPWLSATALYHPGGLDVRAMNEASGHLVGEHDFRSFGRAPDADASPMRILYELSCRADGDLVRIRARANAFLHQMVRSLVGTLVQVGDGRRSPDDIVEILGAGDRAAAGPVAPPHGLCLVAVEYDSGWSTPPMLRSFGG
ncbi:MAG: tRNA pseudouridine(38-40) synthase TruA [Actinomycetota bacterium]|nr:tRNA pseudouridine(38-40) synthase TruA [Actinomycetota bacterium]